MTMHSPYIPELDRELSPSERSTGAILSDLWNHTEILLHQELELVRADFTQKAAVIKKDVAQASLAGAVLYAGSLTVLAGIVLLLGKWLDVWISALLVGALVLLSGYAMNRKSTRDLKQTDVVPRETGRSLQRTAHTIKEAVK